LEILAEHRTWEIPQQKGWDAMGVLLVCCVKLSLWPEVF